MGKENIEFDGASTHTHTHTKANTLIIIQTNFSSDVCFTTFPYTTQKKKHVRIIPLASETRD